MRRRFCFALFAGAVVALSACSSIDETTRSTVIPARTLDLTPSLTIADSLAPNWQVQVEPLGPQRYRVSMTMRRIFTGGEGEVGPLLRRTAEKLAHQNGFADYAIVEHTEGIDSRVTFAQRYAHAVVELR